MVEPSSFGGQDKCIRQPEMACSHEWSR